MNKFYLVLSVKEINALAKAARESQKAWKRKSTHCVVLDLEAGDCVSVGGCRQITSQSFTAAVAHIRRITKLHLDNQRKTS